MNKQINTFFAETKRKSWKRMEKKSNGKFKDQKVM